MIVRIMLHSVPITHTLRVKHTTRMLYMDLCTAETDTQPTRAGHVRALVHLGAADKSHTPRLVGIQIHARPHLASNQTTTCGMRYTHVHIDNVFFCANDTERDLTSENRIVHTIIMIEHVKITLIQYDCVTETIQ